MGFGSKQQAEELKFDRNMIFCGFLRFLRYQTEEKKESFGLSGRVKNAPSYILVGSAENTNKSFSIKFLLLFFLGNFHFKPSTLIKSKHPKLINLI